MEVRGGHAFLGKVGFEVVLQLGPRTPRKLELGLDPLKERLARHRPVVIERDDAFEIDSSGAGKKMAQPLRLPLDMAAECLATVERRAVQIEDDGLEVHQSPGTRRVVRALLIRRS